VAINYNDWTDFNRGIFRYHDGGYSSNLKNETSFDYFVDDAVAGDCLYFARTIPFHNVQVYVGTPLSASSIELIWEYNKAGVGWSELEVDDNTSGFTETGERIIEFIPPDDWVRANVQDWGMYIRCRIVSVAGLSEGGANSNQKCQGGNNTITLTGYSENTPADLDDIYNADATNGWGVTDQVVTDRSNKVRAIKFNCMVCIGDGEVESYFKTEAQFLYFGYYRFINCKNRGHWVDGEVDDNNYRPMHGSVLYFDTIVEFYLSQNGSDLKLYGTRIIVHPLGYGNMFVQSIIARRVIVELDNGSRLTISQWPTSNDWEWYNCVFKNTKMMFHVAGVFEGNEFLNTYSEGNWLIENRDNESIIRDLVFIGTAKGLYIRAEYSYWIDCTIDYDGVSFYGTNRYAYFKFTLDLRVQDVDGNALEGVSVVIKDKDDNEVYSDTTDESGEISEEVLYATITNDPSQDEITYHSDHKITMSKDGYIEKDIVLTMDRKREEVETLEVYVPPEAPAGINVDVEVQSDIELALSSESPPTQNWYNPNWKYRKKITIGSEIGAGEGYQKLIKVGENEGASGCDFHLDNKSDKFPSYDNSGDLRFTKDDGRTLLDCWIEKVEGDSPNRIAYVYVKIEDNLDEDVDIYCYYGNAEAENISDIDSVMTAGLRYLYFGDTSLSNLLGNDVDVDINHKWNSNVVQINGNDWESRADNVSIRWIGWVKPKTLGDCVFYSTSDDGQRLWVNEESVINDWNYHGDVEKSGNYNIDKIYPIRYEFFEATGGATAKLGWQPFGDSKVYPILSDYLRCRKYLESEPSIDGVSDEEEYSAGSNNCNVGVSVDNPSVGVQVSDNPSVSVQVNENNNILVEKE
jgi:hypothetical protein